MSLRQQGVDNLSQIRRAYLEPSGKISIIREKNPSNDIIMSICPEDLEESNLDNLPELKM